MTADERKRLDELIAKWEREAADYSDAILEAKQKSQHIRSASLESGVCQLSACAAELRDVLASVQEPSSDDSKRLAWIFAEAWMAAAKIVKETQFMTTYTIKPLEWEDKGDVSTATGIVACMYVWRSDKKGWMWCINDFPGTPCQSLEDGKAKCWEYWVSQVESLLVKCG